MGPSSRDDSITVVVDARWGLLDTLLGVVVGETVGVVEGETVGVVEGETVGVVEGETVGDLLGGCVWKDQCSTFEISVRGILLG